MIGKRIIKMTNQGFFFNEKEFIPYTDTNLPKEYFTFSDRAEIYWLVDMNVDFRNGRKVIIVHVNEYEYNNLETFKNQVKKGETTLFIFEKLNFDAFFAKCNSYKAGKFKELFFNFPMNTPVKTNKALFENLHAAPKPYNVPIVHDDEVEFKVNFSDAIIIDGGIQFIRIIEKMGLSITFTIYNEFLKASYEPIKEYFSKKIGRKTFSVKARIKRENWVVVEIIAQSKEIDMINESFIKTIKYAQINSLLKIKQSDVKQLYSIDEILLLSDELQGNLLETNIENIIQVLTKYFSHRNSKQLSYLANNHNTEEEVIHLTVSPYFGFLFSHLNNSNNCYIWELLDTHATYIWIFKKDTWTKKQAFDLVEVAINQIRQLGRNAYKKEYRNGLGNEEWHFYAIDHSIDSQSANVLFEEWLVELKARIN